MSCHISADDPFIAATPYSASDLPLPEEVGLFDEEEARYFLREVSACVVGPYPFSHGIDIVHNLIRNRYASGGMADVLSLLHEILSDELGTAGQGDDEDNWNSWRADWKRSNNDPTNPFVARIGRRALPQPTEPATRRLRAEKFIHQSGKFMFRDRPDLKLPCYPGTGPGILQSEPAGGRIPAEDPTYGHRRSLLLRPQGRPWEETTEKTQGLRYLRPAATRRELASKKPKRLSLSLGSGGDTAHAGSLTRNVAGAAGFSRDGQKKVCSPSQIGTDAFNMGPGLRGGENPGRVNMCPRYFPSPDSAAYIPHQDTKISHDGHQVVQERAGGIIDSPLGRLPSGFVDEKELEQISRAGLATIKVRGAHLDALEPCGFRQLATNEEFPGHPPTTNACPIINKVVHLPDGTTTKSPFRTRLSEWTGFGELRNAVKQQWKPIRQRVVKSRFVAWIQHSSPNLSIAQSLPRRYLRKDTGAKTTTFDTRKVQGTDMDVSRKTSHMRCEGSDVEDSGRPDIGPRFVFDGACDDKSTSSSKSPVDLNKALPLSPGEIVRSMSSRTSPASHFRGTPRPPSPAFNAASSIQTSAEQLFRQANCDLAVVEIPPHHQLHPIRQPLSPRLTGGFDPQKHALQRQPPISFSSIAASNPFTDDPVVLSPVRPPPPLFREFGSSDVFSENQSAVPSILEPDIHRIGARITEFKLTDCHVPPFLGATPEASPEKPDHNTPTHRVLGRPFQRINQPLTTTPYTHRIEQHKADAEGATKASRSKSPPKKFFAFGKSASVKEVRTGAVDKSPIGSRTAAQQKKACLKTWSNRLRFGFMVDQLAQEATLEEYMDTSSATLKNPPRSLQISLDPPSQSFVQSSIELMVCTTANRYLLAENEAGRIEPTTVSRVKSVWQSKNRPKIIDFWYDLETQRDIILLNLKRVKLHGAATQDAIILSSVVRAWAVLARELQLRLFCHPDSVIRRWLHEAHRIIEMLGAPGITFVALQDLQLKILTHINERQKASIQKKQDEEVCVVPLAVSDDVYEGLEAAAEKLKLGAVYGGRTPRK